MSLIMLISKIQDASDLDTFTRIPPEELNRIVRDSPGHVLEVLAFVLEGLCLKIDASDEERTQCVRKVRKRDMGYLFENMEHMSLQEERRKAKEERKKAEQARQETERANQETERARQETERANQETERARQETERANQRADGAEKKMRLLEERLRIAEETIKRLQGG